MRYIISNNTGKLFDWGTILIWCDKLDVDIVFTEYGDFEMEVEGTELEVSLLESAINENTDKYIEEYLWGRIKDYICPFYDKCKEECSSRYNVHFNEEGCPWGYERPVEESFKPSVPVGTIDYESEEVLE